MSVRNRNPDWMMQKADPEWHALIVLPTDYTDYGGDVERWADPSKGYPDCSCGCKWWRELHDYPNDCMDFDWGVCLKPNGPRAGLLTWEHQAGFGCFEDEEENGPARA